MYLYITTHPSVQSEFEDETLVASLRVEFRSRALVDPLICLG